MSHRIALNSPYKSYINELQIRINEHGLRENNDVQMEGFLKGLYPPNDVSMDPAARQVLWLRQLYDIFVCHAVGLVISALVFLVELATHRFGILCRKKDQT